MRPRVSAIIIVLDGERFIGEAIESVLLQQGPAFELLVVDDGSSDRTAEIVGSFGSRARLLAHPGSANLGMSASRNAGISQARGEYVAFLDADDQWLPHKLQEQVALLDREPATAMVYGRTLIWHSWDPGSAEADYMYDLGVPADTTYAAGALFGQLLANRYQSPTTCNAMIRREALLAVGGCDPALRGMFEDQLLFAKLLLRYPTHVSSRTWARYRQHGQSASAAAGSRHSVARQQLRYFRALRNYMVASRGVPISQGVMLGLRIAQLSGRMAARQAASVLRSKLR